MKLKSVKIHNFKMRMFTTEICLIVLVFLNESISIDRIYTTPGSHLVLELSEFDRSIHCGKSGFINIGSILDVSDSGKFYYISNETNQLAIQAPYQLGHYRLGFRPIEQQIVLLHKRGIWIRFAYTPSPSLDDEYDNFRINNGSFDGFSYQFLLNDNDTSTYYSCQHILYECNLHIHTLDIEVLKLEFLNQTDNNIIYGQEGCSINISCAAVKSYDVEKLRIYQYGRLLATSETSIVIYSFVPNRHSLSYFFCMAFDNDRLYVRVKLVVYYAPDVKVYSRENSIDCYPKGFPDTYTFHGWEHQSENGENIRSLDGLSNGTLILQDIRMQYQKSGIYVCNVSNGIPDVNGSISQTGFTYFSYQGAPIFPNDETLIMNVDLYQPLMVTFSIYSNPIIEKIWIEGVDLDHTKNETIHCFKISETKLKYTEFKSNAYMKGTEIVFEFKMFSHEYEMYKLWAENEFGESSTAFKIRTVGGPIFVPENRNVTHGKLGEPLILTFLLFSNPMAQVRIEDDTTARNLSSEKYKLRLKKTTFPYTSFGNIGNISGYEIILEINRLNSNDLHVYKIEANNSLGFDSYHFEIISADFDENNAKPNERFITSSSVAACLLVYIIVMHIYMCVRHRTKRTRRGSIPQSLHFNTYDEIESLSYELVNVRGVSSDQQEQIMQTSVIRNLQDESYITHYNNQLPIDGHTDSSSQSSVQGSQVYENEEVQQNNASGAEVEVSSVLSFDSIESCGEEATENNKLQPNNTSKEVFEASSFGDIVRTVEIYDEKAAVLASDSLQSSQSSGHQDDNLSSSVYENSYQSVNRERQDINQYSVLLNQSEEVDSDRSASTVKLSRNVPDYVNLRF